MAYWSHVIVAASDQTSSVTTKGAERTNPPTICWARSSSPKCCPVAPATVHNL